MQSCVETCYGFWSPKDLNKTLSKELKKRRNKRKPRFDTLKKISNEHGGTIKDLFLNLCERINNYLLSIGIDDWVYGDSNIADKSFSKWQEKLKDKLENKEFYDRMVSGISTVATPDVWGDPISTKEFESSFFESIIYHWSKEYSKKTSNILARSISCNLGFDKDDANEKGVIKNIELNKKIEDWLSGNQSSSLVLCEKS